MKTGPTLKIGGKFQSILSDALKFCSDVHFGESCHFASLILKINILELQLLWISTKFYYFGLPARGGKFFLKKNLISRVVGLILVN